MKNNSTFHPLLVTGLLLVLMFSCKKTDSPKLSPTATVVAVSSISATTATSGGNISSDGGAAITARGVCWSVNQNPTTADSRTTDGTGTGSFTSSITGLSPGITYNIRAYATNSVGTGYSSQSTFITLALAPILTTTVVSAITSTTATSGGNITNDGGSAITARGVCWSTSTSPTTASSKTTDATGSGSFTSAITGLTPGVTYYIRAYATNSIGTAYGNEVTVATTAVLPVLTTTAISALTSTTATSGGNITSDGGAAISARGVCWSTTPTPTIGNFKTTDGSGINSFTSNLTNLTANTTYYVMAYATNSAGTAYGNQVTFTTTSTGGTGTVTDIGGNVYKTITIGTQVWMAENLKTTKYRNGTSIPNVIDNSNDAWLTLTSGAYCNYNNDANNATTYGRLYNWYAVNTGNLAPTGWHVPTDAEWTTLETYLTNNGYGYQGSGSDIAKSLAASSGWTSYSIYTDSPGNDQTSNNSSGFTALPGGKREGNGTFYFIGDLGYWWSSTELSKDYAWYRYLHYNYGYVYRFSDGFKASGFAVRCVKD